MNLNLSNLRSNLSLSDVEFKFCQLFFVAEEKEPWLDGDVVRATVETTTTDTTRLPDPFIVGELEVDERRETVRFRAPKLMIPIQVVETRRGSQDLRSKLYDFGMLYKK
ncbi:hypothetical protein ACFX2G_023093 [Malus domestica]